MKKKLLFLLVLTILLVPFKVFAISGSVSCSPGSKTVTVGQTFTVTISGKANGTTDWAAAGVVNVTGSLSLVGDGGRSFFQQDASSFSKSYTIKANSVGSGTVSQLISYTTNPETGADTTVWSSKCNITVVAANSSNSSNNNSGKNQANVSGITKKKSDPNKSSNNNLKSITVDGVELIPEFNKDTLEYSAIVGGQVEKVTIKAEAEDSKSNVVGLGEKTLEEGLNVITISVYAENSDLKEYKINITREEKNPIEVTIDGKKYTVVKKETNIEIPDGYEKETIKIEEEDVVAYSNKNTTLVVLVDEEGNAGLFVYDKVKDTYTKYVQFVSKGLVLTLTDPGNTKIPYGYKKITFTINGEKVNGYYYKQKVKFRLVYGINETNGDEGFYLYDMEDKTFQRYYDSQVKEYLVYLRYGMYIAAGVALIILILFISIIGLSSKNRKLKKGVKENKKEIKEEKKPVIEEPKKEEKKIATVEEEKTIKEDSREARRLQREEDRKRKAEASDFLK